MEYRKNDMYVQLDKRKRQGWARTSAPVTDAAPAKAEKAARVDEVVKVEKAAVVEMELELGVELDYTVDKVEEHIPVPPVIELPQEGQCGYCITPGMSYTPMQKWGKIYEADQALDRGTIFPVLDYPFMGKGGC